MTRLLLCLLLASLHLTAWSQERITSHDSVLQLNADGGLDVTERISVRAEGNQVRRGIYRDFPTRYKDRRGNRVVVTLEVLGVQRDGQAEPWFTERVANGVRINTGNDSFLPTPGEFSYTLRYRTTRQLGFFDDFDELYWNATGNDWAFPIERATVEVRLPQPVPAANLRLDAYTGAQGQQGTDAIGEVIAPGVARWRTTDPLAPGEGLTIALGFPKGLIEAPTSTQRWLWLLQDNRGVLVALLGLAALLVFCVGRWRRVGKDPRAGVVIARYEPPAGYSPAGLRYMQRMGYDNRCFSADLLSLAVDGSLSIERDQGFLKDKWELQRTPGSNAAPGTEEQRALLSRLFAGGSDTLELDNSNASEISRARQAHLSQLSKRFIPSMFVRNGGSIAIALLLAVGSSVLALAVSGGGGIPLIIVLIALMLVVFIAFCFVIKAPTPAGRALMDEIAGLKLYLGVAERAELASLRGPDAPPALDGRRYESLLPYAVALEVEDAWTRKFTLAAGAAAVAAATANISWYRGSAIGDLGSFSKAVGSSLTSQIASSSVAPGSSSGGGAGGSSGGGGGGGGGGGR